MTHLISDYGITDTRTDDDDITDTRTEQERGHVKLACLNYFLL